MSLDFNLGKIADWKNVCYEIATKDREWDGVKKGEEVMKVETHTIIFTVWTVGGVGRITEQNVEKVAARYAAHQKQFGPLMWKADENADRQPYPVTTAMLRAHVGLTTNWSFKAKTDLAWGKSFAEHALSDAAAAIKLADREAAKLAAQMEADAQDDPDAGTEHCEECGAEFRPRGGGVTCNCFDDDQQ